MAKLAFLLSVLLSCISLGASEAKTEEWLDLRMTDTGESCRLGNYGCGHDQFHAFYATLSMNGLSCCSGMECRPTKVSSDGTQIFVDGEWRQIELKKIVATPAPNNGWHVCAGPPSSDSEYGNGAKSGSIYCIIAPTMASLELAPSGARLFYINTKRLAASREAFS